MLGARTARDGQGTPPQPGWRLPRRGGRETCLQQVTDELVLVFYEAATVLLLGREQLPQLLGNALQSTLIPPPRDFLVFVLAGLYFILQLLQSAERNMPGALGPGSS